MLENNVHQGARFGQRQSSRVVEFAELELFAGFLVAEDLLFCARGSGDLRCHGEFVDGLVVAVVLSVEEGKTRGVGWSCRGRVLSRSNGSTRQSSVAKPRLPSLLPAHSITRTLEFILRGQCPS
jgi:hypothetical protein